MIADEVTVEIPRVCAKSSQGSTWSATTSIRALQKMNNRYSMTNWKNAMSVTISV